MDSENSHFKLKSGIFKSINNIVRIEFSPLGQLMSIMNITYAMETTGKYII